MFRWMIRFGMVAIGLVLIVINPLLVSTTLAQPLVDPVASKLKSHGDSAIELEHYDEALRAYTKALSIEPSPALHYNRARALQGLGRNAEALAEFERFESTASPSLIAAVPDLKEMIEAARRQVAEITVKCDIPGATILVMHQARKLPLREPLRFDPVTLEIEVTAAGYDSWRTRITLEGGEHRELEPQLKRKDLLGTVVITSPVVGARVEVDDKKVGTVPVELRLAPGDHAITLRHSDYETANSRIVVRSGERRSLSVTLERTPRFYERWWFWTGLGTVAATGVVVGIALTTEKSPAKGDIPPGRITTPLVSW
jgi:PEGA domain/Tetratricopeptide repeat